MSGADIDRRAALALGTAAMLAPVAASAGVTKPAAGILLFDATSPEARALARQAHGQRLVALEGDPVRLWRDHLADASGPVGGITRWSDYLLLRDLAAERGLRIRDEERVALPGKPMLVRWTAA